MDEAIHVVLGDSLSNPLSAFDMDILEREVPSNFVSLRSFPPHQPQFPDSLGGIVPPDQVIHHIRVSDTGLDRLRVPQIIFLTGCSAM